MHSDGEMKNGNATARRAQQHHVIYQQAIAYDIRMCYKRVHNECWTNFNAIKCFPSISGILICKCIAPSQLTCPAHMPNTNFIIFHVFFCETIYEFIRQRAKLNIFRNLKQKWKGFKLQVQRTTKHNAILLECHSH